MKLLLYRLWQFTLMWPLMLALTAFFALVTIIGSFMGLGRWAGYYPEIVWSRLMCWVTFVSVSVKGRENIDPATSYVFVCNHQGAYDIFAVYGWLGHNFRWMMKAPLRRIPMVGYACYKSKQIFVDSSSPRAIRRTMEDAEKILRGGMSIVVFPEGSRTRDGRMHRFKRGAFLLADEFNLPVVPVTIDGAYDVLPITGRLPHWGHISLTIHKPICPAREGHDLPDVMERSRDAIASALPE